MPPRPRVHASPMILTMRTLIQSKIIEDCSAIHNTTLPNIHKAPLLLDEYISLSFVVFSHCFNQLQIHKTTGVEINGTSVPFEGFSLASQSHCRGGLGALEWWHQKKLLWQYPYQSTSADPCNGKCKSMPLPWRLQQIINSKIVLHSTSTGHVHSVTSCSKFACPHFLDARSRW